MEQPPDTTGKLGMLTRRSLIAGAATAVTGTLLGGQSAQGQSTALLGCNNAQACGTHRGRIDLHSHFLPPEFVEVARRHGQFAGPPWSAEAHLAFMDRWGIEASVVSMPLNINFGDVVETRSAARAINEAGRRLLDQHPNRFGMHVCLPLPDMDGALAELRYALDTLGFDGGVLLLTHYDGVYLGDPLYEPLYQELDRRGCLAWVHPTFPPISVPPFPGNGAAIIEWPFDTTRAATNLIYKEVLDRYPNIRWQLSHCGGAFPFVLYRIAASHTMPQSALPTGGIPGQVGPFVYANRFFYDTGLASTKAQLEATREFADASQIVFGTDWPFTFNIFAPDAPERWPWFTEFLPEDDDPEPALSKAFSPRERRQIERDNPLALYPSVAARLGSG